MTENFSGFDVPAKLQAVFLAYFDTCYEDIEVVVFQRLQRHVGAPGYFHGKARVDQQTLQNTRLSLAVFTNQNPKVAFFKLLRLDRIGATVVVHLNDTIFIELLGGV